MCIRKRTREQLLQGASQIKIIGGGGVSSPYGPLDTVQLSVDEIRAAVEAAANWGAYVTVLPALGLLDWRVQLASVVIVGVIAGYAIYSMPQVKAKLSKLVEAL